MVSPQENETKKSLLAWAASHPCCLYLDSCGTEVDRYGAWDYLIGIAGEGAALLEEWEMLDKQLKEAPGWWFGALTYEIKNDIETQLQSRNTAAIPFPKLLFFKAETVIGQRKGEKGPQVIHGAVDGEPWRKQKLRKPSVHLKTEFESNFSRQEYLATIERLRQHIKDGDCYEINLAQNYTAQATVQHPETLWRRLTKVSPTPMAAYARFQTRHLLGASPERFLQLRGDRLITQPIKGTSRRSADKAEDKQLAERLRASEKEQAENVMIVDLSRHDLHKSSVAGGVTVPALFEVQSFAKVHHLVSTVQAHKRVGLGPMEAIANTFPPGSMTGAPKFRTCQLIDQYEPASRGIYAGSVGYFDPAGDFDFNVVIRTLIYDQARQQLSYHVGGAITWDSEAASEYEETLVKASAIREVLESQAPTP